MVILITGITKTMGRIVLNKLIKSRSNISLKIFPFYLRIVAAFNFSGLDPVDFDLSQTGLDGSYSLSVDGVRLDGAKSAAELERGIRLTLEPNTCCVYRFTKL